LSLPPAIAGVAARQKANTHPRNTRIYSSSKKVLYVALKKERQTGFCRSTGWDLSSLRGEPPGSQAMEID
jgi:hypothetical protein